MAFDNLGILLPALFLNVSRQLETLSDVQLSPLGVVLGSLSRPKTMWIDFICIAQRNVIEKNAEVRLINSIYNKADKVNSGGVSKMPKCSLDIRRDQEVTIIQDQGLGECRFLPCV
jgi:hypothetical protein